MVTVQKGQKNTSCVFFLPHICMPATPEVLNRNNILLDSGSQQTFFGIIIFQREQSMLKLEMYLECHEHNFFEVVILVTLKVFKIS